MSIAHASWPSVIGTCTAVAMRTACQAPEMSPPVDRGGAPRSIESAAEAELADCVVPRCCEDASKPASPVAALPAIRARLLALVARFRDELPAKSGIVSFFDPRSFEGLSYWRRCRR